MRRWAPAPVNSLESWLMERWQTAVRQQAIEPCTLIDATRERELWLAVIAKSSGADAGLSLLKPDAAAQLAARTREDLLRWQVDLSDKGIRGLFSLDTDCRTFLNWWDAMRDALAAIDCDTAGGCLTRLLAAPNVASSEKVALLAFDDIPPLYQACLTHLSQAVEVVQDLSTAGEKNQPTVKVFPERASELTAIASWAVDKYRGADNTTVGIVLADADQDRLPLEHALRTAFECLGDKYADLPVNFSTGITLDRAPIVSTALTALDMQQHRNTRADVIKLLNSRFLRRTDAFGEPAVRLTKQLFEDGDLDIPTARLRSRCRHALGSDGAAKPLLLAEALDAMRARRLDKQRLSPSQWAEHFGAILAEDWGWPGPGPLDSLEYQQVHQWQEALDAFAAYDVIAPALSAMDYATAVAALRRCCQQRASQPKTADSRIQVLGLLESAGLQFDDLWLCGMQADRFPQSPRPNPFIPSSLQRERDMPRSSVDREWSFASRLLEQLLSDNRSVITSYAQFSDGIPSLPSPLLDTADAQLQVASVVPGDWADRQRSAVAEALAESQAPAVGSEELQGIRGGSGLVEDQSACAFRAFALRRLNIRGLDDADTGLSASDRGNLVHAALQIVWQTLRSRSQLAALSDAERRALAEKCAVQAIAALRSDRREIAGAACLALEEKHLAALLLEWFAVELGREDFTVLATEEDRQLTIGGLTLNLRMDRIDELGGGETLLIDYKTGSTSSVMGWLGDRPRAPQLPLYTQTQPVQGIAYAKVRRRSCEYRGLGECEGVPGVSTELTTRQSSQSGAENWPDLVAGWAAVNAELVEDFLAGEASVAPLKGACEYCNLRPLCRIDTQDD